MNDPHYRPANIACCGTCAKAGTKLCYVLSQWKGRFRLPCGRRLRSHLWKGNVDPLALCDLYEPGTKSLD